MGGLLRRQLHVVELAEVLGEQGLQPCRHGVVGGLEEEPVSRELPRHHDAAREATIQSLTIAAAGGVA